MFDKMDYNDAMDELSTWCGKGMVIGRETGDKVKHLLLY